MIRYPAAALAFTLSLGLLTCNHVEAFTPASFVAIRTPAPAFYLSNSKTRNDSGNTVALRMVGGKGGNLLRPIRQNDDDEDNEDNDENDDVENEDEDDDDLENEDEDDDEVDPYTKAASSEFDDDGKDTDNTSSNDLAITTSIDWGGAYGKLLERFDDVESGKTGPSNALFRIMSKESPNEAISNFVREANPEVVAVMNGAIGSLLGGLSNPVIGIETIVKANEEKLANLCFQLQMTGYMFRNAEYVLALKDLMDINSSASIPDYKRAFDRIDADGSGYIEATEVESLLADVYDGKIPSFEVDTFLNFFDSNNDGRISWDEFEQGLGTMSANQAAQKVKDAMNTPTRKEMISLPSSLDEDDEDDDDDDDDYPDIDELFGEPDVSGMIEVEFKNGKVIEIEAKEYIKELKKEAAALQDAIRMESGMGGSLPIQPSGSIVSAADPPSKDQSVGGIAGYIASLEGDMKSLTSGISPEVVDTMKLLIDFVMDGGAGRKRKRMSDKDKDAEMEIPGSALQQLALWQLVLGYKLREEEATGDYMRLLDE
eukprot:CAMPEP_0197825736 /NCGR_PEP_ID=MMETSP1437-20131217/2771_1 /TAXON_ID=49252 ORGANISM="Eucampia antarctica, Strain CCMP1452" /NCGR_SAMPLE_ID=MMETSP1437 /ASSEMBLY_ACC=CAM_ASM_001096 /LENGTH=542 /DNA_ID=CAMNT_0043425869 /DNA_START=11 /DNA_END=1639 /DNA_ORIENTATION=+